MAASLPTRFCWTRFGTEAGEGIESICARKEVERRRNGGIFLWGIGNALGPSMRELVRLEPAPEVVFSPMLTAAREADVSPRHVVAWQSGRDLEGVRTLLPEWSRVTSRAVVAVHPRRHFALVCRSDVPLAFDDDAPQFSVGTLANLLTGRPVGASQVTAVVKRLAGAPMSGSAYRVAFRARLESPFLIQLEDPHVSTPLGAVTIEPDVRHVEVGGAPSH